MSDAKPAERKKVPHAITVAVLTEAGYRCAVPTCRTILAIDLHHMVEVSEGGPNELGNLLALCPTCHALFHRGEIKRDSIHAWKSMLISLSHAFDFVALDQLIFLTDGRVASLYVSGDGVLQFSRLIAAGLADFAPLFAPPATFHYQISLTQKGRLLVTAWQIGDRLQLSRILGDTNLPES